ncbi:ABC transporter substrate-binding protein [Pusillimonas sp.]|uniref:ABC transporter substrate-binding protein n=1 Tax=Pusillimonas sp. TaxID=3040095 RepID=UPI0037C7C0DA
MNNIFNTVRNLVKLAAVATAASLAMASAHAEQQPVNITYLLPAPTNAIAFAPLMLAQYKNYYADAGLNVRFVSVRGGADVGKQLGAGNGELGGALGDTPLILRQNGIPVKGVALLGGKALHQLMARTDRDIKTPADLEGKTITVMSYQDTSFFATLAVLANADLTRDDASIQAAGPNGIWQLVANGNADAIVGAPEMGAFAEDAGASLNWQSTGEFFPGMAQAILTSEDMIKNNPDTIRKFVAATLKSLAEVRDDPESAAKAYVEAQPSYKGREALVTKVLTYYANNVYPGQEVLGQFDPQRIDALQKFYLEQGIIQKELDLNDVFTNEFVTE